MLTIKKEFHELLPKLTTTERARLEASLIRHGCRDSIVVWGGIIIDGMNRWEICQAEKISYQIEDMTDQFADENEVKIWIIENQCGRRNLSESQRGMLAAELANLRAGRPSNRATLRDCSRAKAAGKMHVSERTVTSAKAVLDDGSEALKEAVRDGEVPVSTAAAITDLPKAEQTALVKKGPEAVKKAAKEQVNLTEDGLKKPIPARIAQQFTKRKDQIRKWQLLCSRIKVEVLKDQEENPGLFLSFDRAQFEASIEYCFNALKPSKPYCVCPNCGGRGCANCDKLGWISKYKFRSAPIAKGD